MSPLPADWGRLRAPLSDALGTLGLALPESQQERLLAYGELIQRWTRVYNLTAIRNPQDMLIQHLLDCAVVVPPLRHQLAAAGVDGFAKLLDVGSGAGLPGVILAMLEPGWQVTCVDAVAKKATFIRQAAAELGLPNLVAAHGRVEAPGTVPTGQFHLITSRAFSSLADLVALTRPLLRPNGSWAAMKAHLTDAERQELPGDIEMFHVEQLHVPGLDAARCLVSLRPRSH